MTRILNWIKSLFKGKSDTRPSINMNDMTGKQIFEHLKDHQIMPTTKAMNKLEKYCFSEEMKHSGQSVPEHIRRLFPGRRIVTTMHIPRESSPLLAEKPESA